MEVASCALACSDRIRDLGNLELQLPVGSGCRKWIDSEFVVRRRHFQLHVVRNEQYIDGHLKFHPSIPKTHVRAETVGCVSARRRMLGSLRQITVYIEFQRVIEQIVGVVRCGLANQ